MSAGDEKVLERFLDKRAEKKAKGEEYRTYLRWSGRALEVPVYVVVGLLLGMFLESRLGFAPWGTYGGLFFGTLGAIRALYRIVKAYEREEGP